VRTYVYVYGITDRTHPGPCPGAVGVGRPPRALRTVTTGGLAAVVSDAPGDLRPEPGALLAHHKVLERMGTAGTVVPVRFGAVAPDDAAVRALLERRATHLHERLRALDGRDEYRVTAERGAGGEGGVEDARALETALEPYADGVQAGPQAAGRLLDVAFLVPRDRAAAFRDTAHRVRGSRPYLRTRVEGPLPPYSFADPAPGDTAVPGGKGRGVPGGNGAAP
jgi:hypothetical protein